MTDTAPAAPATETAPAPAATGEEAELLALHANDPQVFEYAPYKDTGRTGAQRLVDIRRAQATDAKTEAEQIEQAEVEDTDADGTELVAAETEAVEGETEEETDEADADEEPAEYEDAIAPWAPPEGQQVAEYAKPALEALDKLVGDAEQRDAIVGLYEQMVTAQQTHHAALNEQAMRATNSTLKSELGDRFLTYKDEARDAFKSLSPEFRAQLRGARLADGTLLLNTPGAIRMLHALGTAALQSRSGHHERQLQGKTEMLKAELAELVALRDKDITEYRRPWKATGVSGSDRLLAITRELANEGPAKPSAAALRSEEAELMDLYRTNQPVFEYAKWRDTGMTGAERLTRIRQGRA